MKFVAEGPELQEMTKNVFDHFASVKLSQLFRAHMHMHPLIYALHKKTGGRVGEGDCCCGQQTGIVDTIFRQSRFDQ